MAGLAEAADVHWAAAYREVQRLIRARLVRVLPGQQRVRGRLYEADPAFAGHAELRRFVFSVTGTAAAIRDALRPLDPGQLAWIHGPFARGIVSGPPLGVVSITARRREIRSRLARVGRELGREVRADVMSPAEWAQRLQRHEMRAWSIRRAPRIWLIGDDERLELNERHEIQMAAARKHLLENWREEYEWDEDFDPSRVPIAPGGR